MVNDLKHCYETLGLTAGASSEQVKQAYRDLVKVWHPDRFGSDPQLQSKAQDKLKEINAAYNLITAPPDVLNASSAHSSSQESKSTRSSSAKGTEDAATPPRPKTTPSPSFSNFEKSSFSVNSFAIWLALCTVSSLLLIACARSSGASRTIALMWIIVCSIISFIVSKLITGRNKGETSSLPIAFTGAALGSCFGSLLYDYHSSQLILDVIDGERLTNAGLSVLFKQLFLTLLFSIILICIFKISSKTKKVNRWWLVSSLGGLLAIITLTEQLILPGIQAQTVRSLMVQPKEIAVPKVELIESDNTSRRRDDVEPFANASSPSKSASQRKASGGKRSNSTVQEQRKAVMQWPPQKKAQQGKDGLFIYNEPKDDN